MLQPLASLWRHPARTVFYDNAGLVGQTYSKNEGLSPHRAMAKRRRFGSLDDAINYLRYWLGEPDARAESRWTLHRCSPSSVCTASSPDAWINSLPENGQRLTHCHRGAWTCRHSRPVARPCKRRSHCVCGYRGAARFKFPAVFLCPHIASCPYSS